MKKRNGNDEKKANNGGCYRDSQEQCRAAGEERNRGAKVLWLTLGAVPSSGHQPWPCDEGHGASWGSPCHDTGVPRDRQVAEGMPGENRGTVGAAPRSRHSGVTGSGDTWQRHGKISPCSHSPPQAPIFPPPGGERGRGGGGKLTWKKIEAMTSSCFLPLFFLGCLI